LPHPATPIKLATDEACGLSGAGRIAATAGLASALLGACVLAAIYFYVSERNEIQVPAWSILGAALQEDAVMGGLYLGIAVTSVEALVAMGLVIALM
jgi:hypothetical protein